MGKKKNPKGLLFTGRMPKSGVTVYYRNGVLVTRSATSKEKRSNTNQQFVQRQRMRHSIVLWKALKPCQPMFTNGATNYNGFITLANRLPVVFVPKFWEDCAALLMPDIPVSEGTLLPIKQQLGIVDGTPALITNLKSFGSRHYLAGSHLQRTGETMAPSFFRASKALSTTLRSRPVISATLPALTGSPISRMAFSTCSFASIFSVVYWYLGKLILFSQLGLLFRRHRGDVGLPAWAEVDMPTPEAAYQ